MKIDFVELKFLLIDFVELKVLSKKKFCQKRNFVVHPADRAKTFFLQVC
jgi:hypothetical protein